MNKLLKKRISAYLKEIKAGLNCSFNTKIAFISMLKSQIYAFFEDNADASFEDMVKNFGSPESIAENFESTSDTSLTARRIIIRTIEIASLVVLIAAVIILVFALNQSLDRGYIVIT